VRTVFLKASSAAVSCINLPRHRCTFVPEKTPFYILL